MATVSWTGSILSCSTPMLNGTLMICGWSPLTRVLPGMLQALNQFPKRFVERCGHTGFLTPLRDSTIHEVNFRLALGEHILQHAGAMFARSVGALLHELPRIAVQFDSELFCDGFAFRDEVIEELARGRETRGGAVMKKSQGAHRISGSVENELSPLRASCVRESHGIHSRAGKQAG